MDKKPYPIHKNVMDAISYVTRTQAWYVLDSLMCFFHNEGHSLEGNRAEHDVEWLADSITRFSLSFGQKPLERCSEDSKKMALEVAQAVITVLPQFSDRIASRYLALRAGLETTQEILLAKRKIKKDC